MSGAARGQARAAPARIRAALECPKPRGAIAKVHDFDGGTVRRRGVRQAEIELLEYFANHADLLDVAARRIEPCSLSHAVRWLLVPIPEYQLDQLAAFGAEHEDHEPDSDGEADADREPDADDEEDGTEERADVRPDTMQRWGMPDDGPELVISPEQRERYLNGNSHKTLQDEQSFIRAHSTADR